MASNRGNTAGSGLDASSVLYGGWLALLVWAPIPLASNRPWAWMVLECGVFLLAAGWLWLWAAERVSVTQAFAKSWPALAVMAVWLGWVGITVVALPINWVEAAAPASAAMHRLSDPARLTATISVEPLQTQSRLLFSFALTTWFVLTLLIIDSRDRLKRAAFVLVTAAVIIAIYGTLMHLTNANIRWFGTVQPHGASALGTTGSRNIYANYLVLSLCIGIGLLLSQLRGSSARDWRHFFKRVLESMFTPKIVLRLSLCVLVIALTTTHSRMGNTSFFASLIIAGLIGLALSRHAPKGTVLLLASLLVIDLFIVGSWFGVEKLAERIEQTTQAEYLARQDPSDFVFSQINEYPVFGSGLGTFYAVFPNFRTEGVDAYYDYAHNDFAQFAAETGWVGIALVGLMVLLSFGAALRAQAVRRDPLMRGMSFASIMGIIAMMIHSWVDFNLQIPANAMLFMVILALGWISLNLDRRGSRAG
jgi:O-antigen ligase